MRILARFLIISVVFIPWRLTAAQSRQPAEPWFTVAISTPKAVVTVGSEVKLKVVFVNNTEQDIHYPGAGGPGRNGPVFDIDVRDSSGKLVPETPYGLWMHGKDTRGWRGGSVFAATAHPGGKIEEELMLSKEYDMSKPDEYTVQVRERNPKFRVVKSNSIAITVVP